MRWQTSLVVAALFAYFRHADALYCGTDSCYNVLGVKEKATLADIKKTYRDLSLTYHPDKNDSPGAKAKFQAIAEAYEILSNPRQRKAHDYALDHPEEFMTNNINYYRYRYQKVVKTDLRLVIVGTILLMSAIQYMNKAIVYKTAMDNVRRTHKYKSLVKRIQLEATSASSGAVGGKRKGPGGASTVSRRKLKGDGGLSPKELQDRADAEVNLVGAEAPTHKDTLIYQLAVLPVTLAQGGRWQAEWAWKYWIQKQPYDREAQEYLTRHAVPMKRAFWEALREEEKAAWLAKELWLPEARAAYEADEARKEKRRTKKWMRDAPVPDFSD